MDSWNPMAWPLPPGIEKEENPKLRFLVFEL